MSEKRVLIASPVNQVRTILEPFLASLMGLAKSELIVSYLFIDDNQDPASSHLLQQFQQTAGNTELLRYSNLTFPDARVHFYHKDENTHYWKEDLIWKVAEMKDYMIQKAIEQQFDYIFLIDSDLVLNPGTLEQLVLAQRDVISNVFWTKWDRSGMELPQVWLSDEYILYDKKREEHLLPTEITARTQQFIDQLWVPGVYEVGGLGACTLISRHALSAGLRFAKIPNLNFWGEDRHFCIRAAAMGFPLYVDTHYPAYHIYREANLSGLEAFAVNGYRTIRDRLGNAQWLQQQECYDLACVQYEAYLDEKLGTPEQMLSAAKSLADCWGKLGDTANQVKTLRRALEIGVLPQPDCYCQLGAVYVERKEWQLAIEAYTAAADMSEQDMPLERWNAYCTWLPHLQLSLCYDRLGLLEAGNRHNEIAYSYHPDHPAILYNKAYFAEALKS
ncbi:hypothetical protein [Paenibacillus sp. CF384]|uniref:hypothetical protein n=1 Tax=Paenibacillus sp. CF384 TaxID=1884382 RepID=UPI00089CEEA6|nr:hypothetical protein [Paenibacillus sp. CF384]SDW20034.1 hypothetical protein SAMN05518855_1001629 [Paenibacillus sp. CF384]